MKRRLFSKSKRQNLVYSTLIGTCFFLSWILTYIGFKIIESEHVHLVLGAFSALVGAVVGGLWAYIWSEVKRPHKEDE